MTQLEELEKSKIKVYIDGVYAFLLYDKDISKLKLNVGEEITADTYQKIMEDTIFRRAKQKALAILKFMDRSEQELKKKLAEAFYPEEIITRTIAYVSEYGYLNDERFAAAYVRSRKGRKSKLVIKQELLGKGINKEILDNIFSMEYLEVEEDPEFVLLQKTITKKVKDVNILTWEEKQKLIAQLYRRGFEVDKIKQALASYELEN